MHFVPPPATLAFCAQQKLVNDGPQQPVDLLIRNVAQSEECVEIILANREPAGCELSLPAGKLKTLTGTPRSQVVGWLAARQGARRVYDLAECHTGSLCAVEQRLHDL